MEIVDEKKAIKTLGGIDSLYFFVDVNNSKLYQDLWQKASKDNNLEGFSFLGMSSKKTGFVGAWFKRCNDDKVPLYRIGFKDGSKQKNVNNIFVELYASGIYSFPNGIDGVKKLLSIVQNDISTLLMGEYIDFDNFIVSRCDYNLFIGGYDFSSVRSDMFKARVKKRNTIYSSVQDSKDYEFMSSGAVETLYLGSKRSDIVFKLYNKKLELSKEINKSNFIKESYLKFYGVFDFKDVWNLEFSLKRKALKQYGINTVFEALDSADSIFRDLMCKYVFLGFDLKRIMKYKNSDNVKKLKVHPVWNLFASSYSFSNSLFDIRREYPIRNDLPSIPYFFRDFEKRLVMIRESGQDIKIVDVMKYLNIA